MAIGRRKFLKASALQAALVGLTSGCAPLGGPAFHPGAAAIARGGNPFRHGVASGDPLADRVILWTRVSPFRERLGEPVETHWWLARDAQGQDVVAGGDVEARPERDYTVKVDAGGLEPGRSYYYGFLSSGVRSPVGRTKTLPALDVDRVRMAVVSCSNWPQGFFNAYACIADRADLDLVLHLGDYLYEYGNGEYGDGTPLARVPDPVHETISLEDYRRRHALYKTDRDLQAAHARHPWITVWDDHESANNAWTDGAQNHDPEREGDWQMRKLAAIRAYYEWMPIRELPTGLFRSFRFGELLDLVMLDTRLHGRDLQAKQRDLATASDAGRSLLGPDQTRWLQDALTRSKRAGSVWRVVGQQVIVAPISPNGTDFNPDSWHGYRENRRQLFDHVKRGSIDNLVFLTGDVHSAWAFEIPAWVAEQAPESAAVSAESAAVEFVAPAVSSPPLGRSPEIRALFDDVEAELPHLRYMNLDEQGFLLMEFSAARARAEFVFTEPAERPSRRARCGAVFEVASGTNRIVAARKDIAGEPGGDGVGGAPGHEAVEVGGRDAGECVA